MTPHQLRRSLDLTEECDWEEWTFRDKRGRRIVAYTFPGDGCPLKKQANALTLVAQRHIRGKL